MSDNLEGLIKDVYKEWKSHQSDSQGQHPDEETFVSFIEKRLTDEENAKLKTHFISCDRCAQILALCIKSSFLEEKELPQGLLDKTRSLVSGQLSSYVLDIILKFKGKTLQIINTTGDVLVGQELVPAAVLRSRQVKDFKDEVTILKDFQNIRVEIKIENRLGQAFNLAVIAREKQTQNIIKDLRVSLLKDDLELESYLSDSGKVVFEHVQLGKYTIEITNVNEKLAAILLDINI